MNYNVLKLFLLHSICILILIGMPGCFDASSDPGPGEAPKIIADQLDISFGAISEGGSSKPVKVTISNAGNADLVLNALSLTGTDASQFSLANDACSEMSLAASESRTFEVIFSPASTGVKTATLRIPSNDEDNADLSIRLNGTAYSLAATVVSTFDDLTLADESYWGGANSGETGFSSGMVSFSHTSDEYSWSGFVYSNMTDVETEGYTNQFSAYTLDAASGAAGGVNGSDNYAVSYVALDWMGGSYDPIPNQIALSVSSPCQVLGVYVTNTTYAYLSMLRGDGFADKFGGDSGDVADWFLLQVKGIDEHGAYTGTVSFYLADYRFDDNSKDYLVDQWTWVDLSSLGEVMKLEFCLSSSDVGDYGMNTPSYFAMDDLIVIN